jgi:hypothetical protein
MRLFEEANAEARGMLARAGKTDGVAGRGI